MKQVTVKNTYTYSGVKCDLCKKVGKVNQEILVFGTADRYYGQGGRYMVHRACMEIFILGSDENVKTFKEAKEQKILSDFEELQKKLLEQHGGTIIEDVPTKPKATRKTPAKKAAAPARARVRRPQARRTP